MPSVVGRGRRASLRPVPPPLNAENVALFLDIDGTLLELAATPEGVNVDAAVAALVPALARRLSGALALITGRALADVDRLFPGAALPVAGLHGLVRRAADGTIHETLTPPEVSQLRDKLASIVARHDGLFLEDKGSTLALHYRQAPRLASHVHRVMRACAVAAGASWRLQAGKGMVEIGPRGRDKGTAISEYMVEPPFIGRIPVFVGDDRTDEHGFAAVAAMGGWSVKVGRGPTLAPYRLRDVAAVRTWLGASLASS